MPLSATTISTHQHHIGANNTVPQMGTHTDGPDRDDMCTVDRLQQVLKETFPLVPGRSSPASGRVELDDTRPCNRLHKSVFPENSYDEVYPQILLGDQKLAQDKRELQRVGVTHILNAAQGWHMGQVDTSEAYYADLGLQYMGIMTMDYGNFPLSLHFTDVADFIDKALASGGKVFVHCHQGISRSATLVMVFLMLKRQMAAVEALKYIRLRRAVRPNAGFLKQVCRLDNEIHFPETYCKDTLT